MTGYYRGEEYRIHSYFRSKSTQTVLRMIEQIIVGNRLDEIYNEIKNMLNRKDYESIKNNRVHVSLK